MGERVENGREEPRRTEKNREEPREPREPRRTGTALSSSGPPAIDLGKCKLALIRYSTTIIHYTNGSTGLPRRAQ